MHVCVCVYTSKFYVWLFCRTTLRASFEIRGALCLHLIQPHILGKPEKLPPRGHAALLRLGLRRAVLRGPGEVRSLALSLSVSLFCVCLCLAVQLFWQCLSLFLFDSSSVCLALSVSFSLSLSLSFSRSLSLSLRLSLSLSLSLFASLFVCIPLCQSQSLSLSLELSILEVGGSKAMQAARRRLRSSVHEASCMDEAC